MGGTPRQRIESELFAWMREDRWEPDEARFEKLALALFRFQAEACAPYAVLLRRRGVDARTVSHWSEIPALPTDAFKELEIRSFPAERALHCFRTSGTSTLRRGTLWLDTLELYDASLRSSFRRALLPDLATLPGERLTIRVLASSAREVPDSSLSHMFATAIDEWGDEQSGFDFSRGELRGETLFEILERAQNPVLLCATAFALVHWLDELERRGRRVQLPTGSRLMETGGFKGRTRVISREALYARLRARTGLPSSRVVNQYGMTELGSQFYDSVLCDRGPRRKLAPPWTRVRIVHPETGRVLRGGEPGLIEILDLANTGSVLALRTGDLGRRVEGAGRGPDGFEVLGRAAGAELRGCSVGFDDALRGA